jgi:hypothetical protein
VTCFEQPYSACLAEMAIDEQIEPPFKDDRVIPPKRRWTGAVPLAAVLLVGLGIYVFWWALDRTDRESAIPVLEVLQNDVFAPGASAIERRWFPPKRVLRGRFAGKPVWISLTFPETRAAPRGRGVGRYQRIPGLIIFMEAPVRRSFVHLDEIGANLPAAIRTQLVAVRDVAASHEPKRFLARLSSHPLLFPNTPGVVCRTLTPAPQIVRAALEHLSAAIDLGL